MNRKQEGTRAAGLVTSADAVPVQVAHAGKVKGGKNKKRVRWELEEFAKESAESSGEVRRSLRGSRELCTRNSANS